MRKAISTIILMASLAFAKPAMAQEMGVSFSFFFPKNGYLSTPISPFSLRGIGFDLTRNIAIETGGTLYRMSGMNISNLPFESREPLVGPFFNVLVPLELIFKVGTEDFEFKVKGGGFAFYNFGTKLNKGNIDRALREFHGWEVVNSNLQFDNKLGYGYEFGVEYIQYINRNFGISIGATYFIGGSNLNLRGSATAATTAMGVFTVPIEYPEANLDYTGLEITIGVLFGRR